MKPIFDIAFTLGLLVFLLVAVALTRTVFTYAESLWDSLKRSFNGAEQKV
ncbi:MAG TPA: hypothetical protein VJ719_15320 [Chthoniobacterales bacterium]|nr:hypothetical protein [Chthoniobacterales bacterium]